MQLRDYQLKAVDFLQDKGRGFIVAPAGSGKTIIAAAALKRGMEAGSPAPFTDQAKIIWLANTREQVEQAQRAARQFDINISAHCVAAQPDCSSAHVVIVDEAHHAPASTWAATIGKATGVVWGFSATPWTTDPDRDAVLRAYFQNFHVVPREDVLEHGSITKGVVVVHDLDQPGEFNFDIEAATAVETERRCRRFPFIPREEHERRARWQMTADMVRSNRKRNAMTIALATTEPGSILVLVSSIEHGEELLFKIPGAALVHSKLAKKTRTRLIDEFRDGTLRCMIATSLADEGLDVPRASVLVLAAGGRSAAKIEQRAGRVMRPHEGKEFGVVHDFADRGAPLAYAQFRARAKTYIRLGYVFCDARTARSA